MHHNDEKRKKKHAPTKIKRLTPKGAFIFYLTGGGDKFVYPSKGGVMKISHLHMKMYTYFCPIIFLIEIYLNSFSQCTATAIGC